MKCSLKMKNCILVGISLFICVFAFVGCNGNADSADGETFSVCTDSDGSNNGAYGNLSVTYDNEIYYVGEGENNGEWIAAMDKDGENNKVLYTAETNRNWLRYLYTDGAKLYFLEDTLNSDYGHDKAELKCLNLHDGVSETLYSSEGIILSPVYYGDKLYFLEQGENLGLALGEEMTADSFLLRSVSVKGGDPKDLGKVEYERFTIHNERIYAFSSHGQDELITYDLNGGNKKVIYKEEENTVVPLMFLGHRLLIAVYSFEAPPVYYTIAPDGTDKKKADLGSFDGNMTCNSIGNKLYLLDHKKDFAATNSDLELIPQETSSGDLSVNPEYDLYQHEYHLWEAEWDKDGNITVPFDTGVEDSALMGSFSGDWVFTATVGRYNDRILTKVRRGF